MLYVCFFLALVLIPFGLLVAMPSWRSFLAMSALMAGAMGWIVYDVLNAMNQDDGLAPIGAVFLFGPIAFGAVAGFLTRAIGLAFRTCGAQIGESLAPWYGLAAVLFAFAGVIYVTS